MSDYKPDLKGRFSEPVDLKCQLSVKRFIDRVDYEELEESNRGWIYSFRLFMSSCREWIYAKIGRRSLRRHKWKAVPNTLGAEGIASALETIQGEEQYERWFVRHLRRQLDRGEYDQEAYEVFQIFKKLKHLKLKSLLFQEFKDLQYMFLDGFESIDEFIDVYSGLDFTTKVRLLPQLDEGQDVITDSGEFSSMPGQLYAIKSILEEAILADQGVELKGILARMTCHELEELAVPLVDLYLESDKPLLKLVASYLPSDAQVETFGQLEL